MKLIDISTTKFPDTFASVDDDDFESLNKVKWTPLKSYNTTYAARSIGSDKKTILMHRVILNPDRNQKIDHKDGDGLNNQRNNLRICSNQENAFNSRKTAKSKSSKYKGVHFSNRHKKFIAGIQLNKKTIHLGAFETEIEAALAYNDAAVIHFGQFARINFV